MLLRDVTTIAGPPARVHAFFEAMADDYPRWHPDRVEFLWLPKRGLEGGRVFQTTLGRL